MTIRKKNGEPYKLYGPNPLLVGQERFDDDPVFRIHNFNNYKAEVYDIDEPEIEYSELEYTESETVVIAVPEPAEPIKYDKPIEKAKVEKIVEKVPEKQSQFRTLARSSYFCLPSKIEETYDELYQEKRTHITYNKPFKFAGATVKFTDTNFMVWTTLEMSPRYSIIYDIENKRWWKVAQIINDLSGDGYLIHCHISDLEPDFSSLAN